MTISRRDVLAGLLMPSLSDAWFLDRSPGTGKKLINPSGATGTVGVNGVIGLGQPGSGGSSSVPATYPVLPEPGTTLPPPGGDRSSYLLAFKATSGFDGHTQIAIPTTTDSKSWAFSCWLNFGVDNVVGFTPTPLQGSIIIPANGDNTYAGTSILEIDPQGLGGLIPGIKLSGLGVAANASFTWPSDAGLAFGWVHLMISARTSGSDGSGGTFHDQYICWINDTEIINTTTSAAASGVGKKVTYPFSVSGATIGLGTTTSLYAAVTELWEAPNQFIDWSVSANRYKFHASDAGWGPAHTTFAPVDIGPTGKRPTGVTPRMYLSGPPSLFNKNRANGGATLTLTGDALVLVDDLPS